MIVADSLSRMFGTETVLSDVSFSVPEGTVCSLLGPNGAGKTTLLKLLMGLVEPTRGIASIGGESVQPRSADVLQKTGCLIDGFEPPGRTRIRDLLDLSADVSPEFDHQRAHELLSQKHLSSGTLWKTMSKGQKRWTLLALLLCRRCRILLLDEPADGLDPESRQQLYQLIRRDVNESGISALITTHIINDIEKITDDVCILNKGAISLHSELDELRDQVVVLETRQPTNLPPGVQTLKVTGTDTFTQWLRDGSNSLPASLPGEIRRRRPGLEELYLAIVSQSSADNSARDANTNPVDLPV